jgi:hypothetical protein
LLHCTTRSAMPVLLMDTTTQVRGIPHYDCAEMVFKPSEAFALEFTPHNPKDKNSILARLTYGDSIVGHVAAEACVEIATLRREYATTTLLISAVTLGPAKFGRKGLHVPIQLWCFIKCTNTSEKDARLAQKLGQLQPFLAVFPQECTGQLTYFGPT